MNVLVLGGAGFIGSALTRELVGRGHEVAVLSRNPRDADLPDAVERIAGDVTAYDSIEAAFEGRDAVVNLVALPPMVKPEGGDEAHDRVHRGGTENALRAAEAHGVERFVQQSANGADPDGPTAYMRAKGRAERLVRESDLDWTTFRPSIVFGDGDEFTAFTKRLKAYFAPGLPVYPLPGGGQTPFQPIWVEDFVPLVAAALEDDRHVGAVYTVGGPEVLTLAEVARLVFRAEGRSVTVVSIPMALARVGLAVGEYLPFFPLGLDQYRSLQFDDTVPENDVAAFGVDEADLRTFESYLGLG